MLKAGSAKSDSVLANTTKLTASLGYSQSPGLVARGKTNCHTFLRQGQNIGHFH